MSGRESPSPLITVFVRAVSEQFPPEQQQRLAVHRAAIDRTTDREDGRRALRCAHWAIEIAGDHELPHPEWRRIKEAHELWKETWLGAEFALMFEGGGRPAPLEDVGTEWVEGAIETARVVGENLGWDHVPWEELLVELVAMEPDTTSGGEPDTPPP